eukprot:g48484.t1
MAKRAEFQRKKQCGAGGTQQARQQRSRKADISTSANVVYCIHCSRCDLLYIGETKQRLGHHFAEHLRSVHDKRQHLPVANHFNSPSHSLDDMSI